MDFLAEALAWLLDPSHWVGADGVHVRVLEHLQLSATAVAIASAIALPAGLLIGHTGRGALAVIGVANIGRAVPSIAMISIALIFTTSLLPRGHGLGFWPTVVALVFLAIPPIVSNAHVGVSEVDRDLVEAARGMGMGEAQILSRVEVPLALPVIVAGLRTASVQVVATATLGAIIASGGLGRYLIDGIATRNDVKVFVGAVLVALLAIATEAAFAVVQRRVVPHGVTWRGETAAARPETVPAGGA